jgi:hypothetical protein
MSHHLVKTTELHLAMGWRHLLSSGLIGIFRVVSRFSRIVAAECATTHSERELLRKASRWHGLMCGPSVADQRRRCIAGTQDTSKRASRRPVLQPNLPFLDQGAAQAQAPAPADALCGAGSSSYLRRGAQASGMRVPSRPPSTQAKPSRPAPGRQGRRPVGRTPWRPAAGPAPR